MKVKVLKYVAANKVLGESGKDKVLARVPLNARAQVGDTVDFPDSECSPAPAEAAPEAPEVPAVEVKGDKPKGDKK